MIAVAHDRERLARSLIDTGENATSRPLCRADLDDALRRCDSPAERRDVAAATIRLYTCPVSKQGADRHA